MEIVRVFPRRTAATPVDDLAFCGPPPRGFHAEETHISVAFSYDLPRAESLAEDWRRVGPVKMGGPALGDPGGEFTPGRYLKRGYVVTSRGCPNNCWFCDVHGREGEIRELEINDGYNILDPNLLACSEQHIRAVFKMLGRQEKRAEFTGGFEARRLLPWHVDELWKLRPSQMFFAFDKPGDLEPLEAAGTMLRYANFTRRHLRCFVLIGYPDDTMNNAERRLLRAWRAGFMPMAMLFKDKDGAEDKDWRKFSRTWARPALTKHHMRRLGTPPAERR